MAATGTAAAAATGKLLVLLLLGLTAPAAALAGYIEVRTRRAPDLRLLRSPGSTACGRAWDRGRGARLGAAAGCLPPTPPARLSFAQSLAPRSGCLCRRRGQMKGVGAAGPPQPPTRWRRRRILGDTAPRALPPPGPCAPQPCALRPRGALNGAACTGSPVPAAVGGLGFGLAPWRSARSSRWPGGLGSGDAAPALASGRDAEGAGRGGAARAAGRSAPSLASQSFAQVWQTREPGFPPPRGRWSYPPVHLESFRGYFTWVRVTVIVLHQRSPPLTWWSRLGSQVVGGSSGRWKSQDVGCGTRTAACSAPSLPARTLCRLGRHGTLFLLTFSK
jgi:hypothetical protein